MKNITIALKTAESVEVKERALEELEFLVHQIDNAADLMQLDGVELLLELIENGVSEKIRKFSAETVAAAAQGNSKVKVEFVNGRAVSRLLTQIIKAESDAWTKKLLYPLGAIIRDFPYAQSIFYRHGGAQILLELSKQKNFALKSLHLISDLLREEKEGTDEESDENRKKQYRELHTKKRFLREEICSTVPSQLSLFFFRKLY